MTRDEFDTLFLQEYDNLCRYAKRKAGDEGPDIVQNTYLHALEHQTYINRTLKYAKRWLYFKLCRELVRYRKTLAIRHEAEQEGHQRLEEGMKERTYENEL